LVKRYQVSLTITDEKSAWIVDRLRAERRLKPLLVRFLDKYAENPELAELWLDGEGSFQEGVVEENEKLTKLKSSLALFTTFLEAAKMQNDANVESFTDYLTNEEFIRFRTEFEKSERKLAQIDSPKELVTVGSSMSNPDLEKDVKDLRQQVEELKTIVLNAVNGNSLLKDYSKISVTPSKNEYLSESEEIEEEIEDLQSEPPKTVEEEPILSVEEPVEEVDLTEALAIAETMGILG